jgi:hypothetical protein
VPAAKPENKNVARAVRCGGEVVKAGVYEFYPNEDVVVLSLKQLDAFVSACGQIDRV